jgi:cytochrome c biogenesis protein ResB
VSIAHEGRQEISSFPIEVNHPLRLRGLTVYQSSWDVNGRLLLNDQDGNAVAPPSPGDYFQQGDSRWMLASFQRDGAGWSVMFQRYRGADLEDTRILRPGDSIGPFTVTGISAQEITGLKAVQDPGLAPFLIALLLITTGLCLTFIQKRMPSASQGMPSKGGDTPT